jgi:hypothetical protein
VCAQPIVIAPATFDNATVVSQVSFGNVVATGSSVGAVAEAGAPVVDADAEESAPLWMKWTAPSAGTLFVSTGTGTQGSYRPGMTGGVVCVCVCEPRAAWSAVAVHSVPRAYECLLCRSSVGTWNEGAVVTRQLPVPVTQLLS